jgi:hypothetical protein
MARPFSGLPIWLAGAEPALADLNGDGNAEIIVSGVNGTFAFTHDGDVFWHNPDVASFYTAEQFGWGGPASAISTCRLSQKSSLLLPKTRCMCSTTWATSNGACPWPTAL